MADENEWLECLPWDGEARSLPTGGYIAGNLDILDFVKSYIYLDSNHEIQESKEPIGKVIDVTINEELFNRITSIYGPKGVKISGYDNDKGIDRWEWKDTYGTDGLKLWILSRLGFKGK